MEFVLGDLVSLVRAPAVPSLSQSLPSARPNQLLEENWGEHKVQDGGSEESAYDDYGHRVLDFVAGLISRHDDRKQRECGRERGHQNGRQTFFRTS